MGRGWGQTEQVTLTADSSFVSPYTCGLIGGGYKATLLDLGGKILDVKLGTKDRWSFFWLFNTDATKGTIRTSDSTIICFGKTSFRGAETTLDIAGGLEPEVPVTVSNLVVRTYITTASGSYGSEMVTVLGTLTPVSDWLHNFTLASGATIDLNHRVEPFCLTSPLTGKTLGFAANAKIKLDLSGRKDLKRDMKVLDFGSSTPTGVRFTIDETTHARFVAVSRADGIYLLARNIIILIR